MFRKILILVSAFIFISNKLLSEEFLTPIGKQKQVNVQNDEGKYFLVKPGQELSFKVKGQNSIKIHGRILNPSKSGNASFMVYEGSSLIGAMLVTPKSSGDIVVGDKKIKLSEAVIQEFSISDGEHTLKIKSSVKSPDAIVAVEVTKSAEASIDLVPLVPLAPLTPSKKEEKTPELELVPLVPLTPAEPKVAKKEDGSKPVTEEPIKKGKPGYKEIIARSSTDLKKKETSSGISTVVETTEKAKIDNRHIQMGFDLGMIIPFQNIGGPYFDGEARVFYFPIRTNPSFGLGLNVGYHNLEIDIKEGNGRKIYSMTSSLIPIDLLFMYSLPVSKLIETDLFAGGGITIVSADLNSKIGTSSKSGSTIAPSFVGAGAISLKLGKNQGLSIKLGYIGGRTSLDFVKDLDVGGLFVTSGYNYTF